MPNIPPKIVMGGDDDEEEIIEEEPTKPRLDKYGLGPDINIREIFWKIIEGKIKDLKKYQIHRFAIANAACAVLASSEKNPLEITKKELVKRIINLLITTKWTDAFKKFLDCSSKHTLAARAIANFTKTAPDQEQIYVLNTIKEMLRNINTAEVALNILIYLKDPKLLKYLKRELILFARGGVGTKQYLTIEILSRLKEDFEVQDALIMLLSHWDDNTRLEAANALKGTTSTRCKHIAKTRYAIEQNEEVKKALKKLI